MLAGYFVLIPRVLTALVMLGILIPVVFAAPQWLWGGASLLILAIAFKEWSALLPGPRPGLMAWSVGLLVGLLVIGLESTSNLPPFLATAAYVGALIFWIAWAPRRLVTHLCHGGGRLLALLLLAACWLALLELRERGAWILVIAMAIVWVADIAAYFVGRATGRHKLAPAISPGKSWEGVVGGVLAVCGIGLWLAKAPFMAGSLPAQLYLSLGPAMTALALAALAGLSVVGDLHESLLKRQAGVKDSGRLLPGHGGFLDRIDALVPTMPVVALLHQVLR